MVLADNNASRPLSFPLVHTILSSPLADLPRYLAVSHLVDDLGEGAYTVSPRFLTRPSPP